MCAGTTQPPTPCALKVGWCSVDRLPHCVLAAPHPLPDSVGSILQLHTDIICFLLSAHRP